MSIPTVKDDPYKKGTRRRATALHLWTEAQWKKLVEGAKAAEGADDAKDADYWERLAAVPPAIPSRCLRLIAKFCAAVADDEEA